MKTNEKLCEVIAQKFMNYLKKNKINCEDEDEACCIFEQLLGEILCQKQVKR